MKYLAFLCYFLFQIYSSSQAVIKCNESIFIGELQREQLKSADQVLTELFGINATQIKHVKYEGENEFKQFIYSVSMNPFMNALHIAFSNHLPLNITADIMWYLITDAVAIYIKKNADKVRHSFVDFDGTRKLSVNMDNLNDWPEVIDKFTGLIRSNTKAERTMLFGANFSTTSQESFIVSQIVLMDSMQKYFKYYLKTSCGIPEIRLLGTRNDWVMLKEKMNGLVGLIDEFTTWRQSLNELLQQFINVFDQNIDFNFWNDIYKIGGYLGSGDPDITGWATTFFPYLSRETENMSIWKKNWKKVKGTFSTKSFNARMSFAPFQWNKNGVTIDTRFFGGLIGINYNQHDRSLMPIFGYGAYEK